MTARGKTCKTLRAMLTRAPRGSTTAGGRKLCAALSTEFRCERAGFLPGERAFSSVFHPHSVIQCLDDNAFYQCDVSTAPCP
jgi:hypothetical protein